MLDDYKKAVVSEYQKKKAMGMLSTNLQETTCRKLKDECLEALKSRTQKKDEKIIRDFFNNGDESNDYSASIKRFDRDRFKPLDNFISGETDVRDDRNVEILAWLINFEPRPYNYKIDYTEVSIETTPIHDQPKVEKEDESDNSPVPPFITEKEEALPAKSIFSKTRVAVVILLLLFGGVYLSIANSGKAYVCEHGTGIKYHLSPKCPALKICKNGVVETTVTDAEENGKIICAWEKK